jgi:hypothetical protein
MTPKINKIFRNYSKAIFKCSNDIITKIKDQFQHTVNIKDNNFTQDFDEVLDSSGMIPYTNF